MNNQEGKVNDFCSIYGPVISWRYGVSLGVDPIGVVSTCSFNCVYCQLGEIERMTSDRQIFIPTEKILQDLQKFDYQRADIITLSGSGEPTLAGNLGEIISQLKVMTNKPVLVLTNASLLNQSNVRKELALADKVSAKLDTLNQDQLQRVNRPVESIKMEEILTGIKLFRKEFSGELGIQTMVLAPWSDVDQDKYIEIIREIQPDEIHLNTPKRPKPLKHQLDARGDHSPADSRTYEVRILKCVDPEVLQAFANKIKQNTGIPVRLPVN
jgi:wyosine [tRNA(Phe)-imidazoG37] synthetase (radical SAM superfamily)